MKKHKVEQRSDSWFQIRKGKITGTTLRAIMGTPKARQDAMYEIIAERLTIGVESESGEENAMDRGTRLEPEAVAMFEFETGKKVEIIGFAEDDDNPMIANSPDGLIGDDEAIEIKCMGGKNHVKMWITNEVPEDYFWQSVQYFVVNKELKTLYFVGYNPDISVHPLHIIEVERGDIEDEIKSARAKQEEFLAEVEERLKGIIKL